MKNKHVEHVQNLQHGPCRTNNLLHTVMLTPINNSRVSLSNIITALEAIFHRFTPCFIPYIPFLDLIANKSLYRHGTIKASTVYILWYSPI